MDYQIKHITTERELDDALAFNSKAFGVPREQPSLAYTREKWLERMQSYGDLMLYAERRGEVIGIVFGRIEKNCITVGPVAVDERFRYQGIAREMMYSLEKCALRHGLCHLVLGADESAEGFYQRLGYTGVLLIQSEKHCIDELLSLNVKYRVLKTSVYDGMVSQIYLDLPMPDRDLQRKYEKSLSGCYTQMIFSKTICKGDYECDK